MAIIQERSEQKRQDRAKRDKDAAAKASKARYLEEQIGMLKHELAENRRDQAIADKAQQGESRRDARQEKREIRTRIEKIKEKLAVDLSNDAYIERDLARINDSIKFKVVKK